VTKTNIKILKSRKTGNDFHEGESMQVIRQTGFLWAAAVAITTFLCLAGCQGGKDDSLDKIKKAGYIRIAMGPGYPPFAYHNAKQELVGFDVGVAKELAKRMGVEVKLVAVDWQKIIDGLNARDYDAILGSMSVTEERTKVVDFSVPYYFARSQVMVPKNSPIKTVKDLKDKTVGAMAGSTFESDAKRLGAGSIRQYKTNDDTLAALKRKEVDAVVTDDVVGMYAKNRMGLDIEDLGGTLSSDKIAIAVRKGDGALLKKIDAIVGEMKKDGTLTKLVERMASNKYDEPEPKK
jgi:polar amino acid transport system substrate-binding protein